MSSRNVRKYLDLTAGCSDDSGSESDSFSVSPSVVPSGSRSVSRSRSRSPTPRSRPNRSNREKRFDWNAIQIFATYSQAPDLTREIIRDWYLKEGAVEYVVGQEAHEDGGKHFHVYAKFEKKKRTRNPRYFDINGYHPNVSAPRSVKACFEYCTKDDENPLSNFVPGEKKKDANTRWGEILDGAADRKAFFELVRKEFPKDYVLNHEKLEYFVTKHYPEPEDEYERPDQEVPFHPLPEMEQWAKDNLEQVRYRLLIFLCSKK